MPLLDDTDREILSILRADARTPVAVLAQRLRIARGTAQARLRKLEEGGVITGYTVRLRPVLPGRALPAGGAGIAPPSWRLRRFALG